MRFRSTGAIVLLIVGTVLALAWLRYRPGGESLPAGSSHATQPNGARALFLWLEAAGVRPLRLESELGALDGRSLRVRPDMLVAIQPLLPRIPLGWEAFDDVADRGGTLVLAGDTAALGTYLARVGIEMERRPAGRYATGTSPATGLRVPVDTPLAIDRASRTAQAGTPLLVAPGGEWLAVRLPYRRGSLVAIAGARPLTNAGLRDPDTARFVYREIIAPLPTQATVAFDETNRIATPAADSFMGQLNRWVLRSPVGGAAVYAGAIVFLYLYVSGRRLGPALRPTDAGSASRTMYEHVQALAGLYRRGRQFAYLRRHYASHYRRAIARALGTDTLAPPETGQPDAGLAHDLAQRGLPGPRAQQLAEALEQIDRARSERQLIAAVARAEEASAALPRRFGTIPPP